MFFAASSGLLAAILVQLTVQVFFLLPHDPQSRVILLGIVALVVFGITAGLPIWVGAKGGGKRPYDGLGDLFFQVHEPVLPDSPERWGLRAFLSFFVAMATAFTGAEGASIEAVQALAIRVRPRSSRWFDLRRRSDVSIAVAASVGALFQAPLTGIVVALELAVGGRSMQAVLASIVGASASQILGTLPHGLNLRDPAGTGFAQLQWNWLRSDEWGLLLGVGVLVSLVGIALVRCSDWCERRVESLSREKEVFRGLIGAVGLVGFLVALPELAIPSTAWLGKLSGVPLTQALFESTRVSGPWSNLLPGASLVLGLGICLAITWGLATWGGAGVVSPLFIGGAFLGNAVALFFSSASEGQGSIPFGLQGALLGGAALAGTVLGTPVAAALLVAELSGQVAFFFPAFAVTLVGAELRSRLKTMSLPELEAARRGLIIHGGRSESVLDSILVREAMTTEVECVRDHEVIRTLADRVETLRHPFFPVIDSGGKYVGMTTLDEVMDAQSQTGGRSSETSGALGSLLEVKDLLYRAGWRSPTVLASQPLSSVQGLFEETPCIPVLSEDRRVLGLLFVHQVRLAYDREVGRRTLGLRSSG